MKNIMTSEQACRGIAPEATEREIHCYKGWLLRVERGSSIDDYDWETWKNQGQLNDIDIRDDILLFYKRIHKEKKRTKTYDGKLIRDFLWKETGELADQDGQ